MSKFEVRFMETQHMETRRGVAAVSKIRLKDGPIVAELDDQPEAIVARVTFNEEPARKVFLEEAKLKMMPKMIQLYGAKMAAEFDDTFFISEYARQMSMDADAANLARMHQSLEGKKK